MTSMQLQHNEVLLVASRGTEPQHGLWRWNDHNGSWEGKLIDTVDQLSALTGHPDLPVVYGTSGVGHEGTLHAWRVDNIGEIVLGETSSEGGEPCHLVVDPTGRLLIATNYTTSTLALQKLAADGSFDGEISLLKLTGGGPETARQDAAHPHQAFFNDDTLIVIDLGADLIREFRVIISDSDAPELKEIRTSPTPSGSGPRHGVVLADGRLAVSGELGENLLTGHLGQSAEDWADVRSTQLTGPAKTRWDRNYPGDIQRSVDGTYVYFANRSYNSLATFDVSAAVPVLMNEIDTAVDWPQHILVRSNKLLVAGWDSSRVVALPTKAGIPQGVETLFDCEGACWLHLHQWR